MSGPSTETRYLNKKVLVTGGAGFIGRRLKARLAELGAVVYSLDNRPVTAQGPNDVQCDIRDAKALNVEIGSISPEIVFHLAACIDRTPEPAKIGPMLEVNLFGTLNLFEALKAVPACRSVVLSGTGEEYGSAVPPFMESYREDPVGPYSFSKLCVTYLAGMFFKVYRLPVIVFRPTLAYGPGQEPGMFIPSLIRTLSRGERFQMTEGEQVRDFIYVDDLVQVYLKAGVSGTGFGEVFNIGSGETPTIRELALKIASLMDKEALLDIGLKPYRPAEIMDYRVDFSKARKAFGWRAETGLDKGLKLTIASELRG